MKSSVWRIGLLAAFALPAHAQERIRVAPTPGWVDEAALPADPALPQDEIEGGAYHLLWDKQVHAARQIRYHRSVRKIVSSSGVQNFSEIKLSFDPSYQRLVFHHVRLLRGGHEMGHFDPSEVKLLHEETDLDERIYNGSLSAILFMKDVRPGDTIDYAYSLEGENPILDGKYADSVPLAFSVPIARLRLRLVWPAARTLHVTPRHTELAAVVEERGAERVYTWERRDVRALRQDADTPGWFDPDPRIELSDFGSWADVARWAHAVFVAQDQPSARLKALAQDFRAGAKDDEEAARRAVRFVQDQVRYLGIEMGPHSHRPHRPEDVLAHRFGDCKDKALLLVVLLRELGLDAAPALVNTDLRRGLDERPPSPFAFDHAIAELRLAGKTLWIDATQAHQGGRLGQAAVPPFERALVLREGAQGLTHIEPQELSQPTTSVEETYTLAAESGPARLDVTTTYRGADADAERGSLAEESLTDKAARFLEHYADADPEVKALGPPTFSDDREANVVVAREAYELPNFWKSGGVRDFYAWAVGDNLAKPGTRIRTTPLHVTHPVHVAHTLVVNLPGSANVADQHETFGGRAFSVETREHSDRRSLTLGYNYRSLRDAVTPEELGGHFDALRQARDGVRYRLRADTISVQSGRGWSAGWLGLGLVGALVWGVARGLSRRRRAAGGDRRGQAGETPGNAVAARDDGDVERQVRLLACACGAAYTAAAVERSGFTYDESRMTVAAVQCAGCGRVRHVYFHVATVAVVQ